MSKKAIVTTVVIVAVVGLGAVLLAAKKPSTSTPTTTTATSTATDTTNSSTASNDAESAAALTIAYTDSGFSPSGATVASGDRVKFVNQSDSTIEPASNPHPVHTDNPQLNLGDIKPGQSKTVTLTTKGTWGFHNHYQSSVHATITVQ